MVGNNQANRPVPKSFPQLLAIRLLTNRRATLKLSRTLRNLLSHEVQIMRTRLSRDPNSLTLRPAQHRNRVRRRKMDDVNAGVEFAAQPNHQLDRFVLSRPWPRLEKRSIVTCRNRTRLNWIRQLSMNDQERIESCQLRHRFAKIRFGHMLKLINPRRNQKTLKPNDTRGKHRRQLRGVPRHDATPEPHVDQTIMPRVVQLCL